MQAHALQFDQFTISNPMCGGTEPKQQKIVTVHIQTALYTVSSMYGKNTFLFLDSALNPTMALLLWRAVCLQFSIQHEMQVQFYPDQGNDLTNF